MATRRTLTVSITPEQDALVKACLASGRFASASEVVRAGLRLLERAEATELPVDVRVPEQSITFTTADPAIRNLAAEAGELPRI